MTKYGGHTIEHIIEEEDKFSILIKKDDEILDVIKRVFNAIVLGKNTCDKDCKEECKNK
mgnify:CR=1 FL=1